MKPTARSKHYSTSSSSSTIHIWDMSLCQKDCYSMQLELVRFLQVMDIFRCTTVQKPLNDLPILNSFHLPTETRMCVWASQNVNHTKFQEDIQPKFSHKLWQHTHLDHWLRTCISQIEALQRLQTGTRFPQTLFSPQQCLTGLQTENSWKCPFFKSKIQLFGVLDPSKWGKKIEVKEILSTWLLETLTTNTKLASIMTIFKMKSIQEIEGSLYFAGRISSV